MTDEIRYGIIGAGIMGIEHIQNVNHIDGAVVTAIADPIEGMRAWGAAEAAGEVELFLREEVSARSRQHPADVDVNQTFPAMGLDSLAAVELIRKIEDRSALVFAKGHLHCSEFE